MDMNSLMASLFFGLVGTGMFMYGKKAGRMIPLAAGVLLMAIPYFIANLALMIFVCTVLMASPWLVNES